MAFANDAALASWRPVQNGATKRNERCSYERVINLRAGANSNCNGVTMMEVLISALLIFLALGGILAMNARSIHILRSTRQATATSQMLQQRIEAMRSKPWPEISNGAGLERLLAIPPESEREVADSDFIESLIVSVPDSLGQETSGGPALRLMRQGGQVVLIEDGDFGKERTLLISFSLKWTDATHQETRILRTIICRTGLTQSGIGGGILGHPETP